MGSALGDETYQEGSKSMIFFLKVDCVYILDQWVKIETLLEFYVKTPYRVQTIHEI